MRRATVFAGIVVASVAAVLLPGPSGAGDLSVGIGINIGTPPPRPPIVVQTRPEIVVVPGTSVYYAPGLDFNFFFYGGKYYSLHNGAWFYATTHSGPWINIAVGRVPQSILAVPVNYYKVPPGHLKKGGAPGRGKKGGPRSWAGPGKGPKRKKW